MTGNQASKLIVLVDDDEINMFICKKLLKIFDPEIETMEFLDSTSALEFVKRNTNKISLLLLDLNMPKLNGWQFLDKITMEDIGSEVVILSSSIDPNDFQKAKKEGKVKDYWSKPLTLDMLTKYFA